jgi:hypothetical protein
MDGWEEESETDIVFEVFVRVKFESDGCSEVKMMKVLLCS